MTAYPEDIILAAKICWMEMPADPVDEANERCVELIVEAILAERDQAKQTAKAALRFVDKALNDISDSEDDAIDSLERARLELVEITEA